MTHHKGIGLVHMERISYLRSTSNASTASFNASERAMVVRDRLGLHSQVSDDDCDQRESRREIIALGNVCELFVLSER